MTSNVYNALQAIKSIVDLDLIPNFSQMVATDPLLPIHIDDAIVKLNDITTQLGAISSPPSLVYEYVVSGSPATSITIPNLDINSHKGYMIEIDFENVNSGIPALLLYVNGDVTRTNYNVQSLYSNLSNTNSTSITDAQIGTCDSLSHAFIHANLSLSETGYYRWTSTCLRGSLITAYMQNFSGLKKGTITNLHTLTFLSSIALSIGIGTRIRIFRKDT